MSGGATKGAKVAAEAPAASPVLEVVDVTARAAIGRLETELAAHVAAQKGAPMMAMPPRAPGEIVYLSDDGGVSERKLLALLANAIEVLARDVAPQIGAGLRAFVKEARALMAGEDKETEDG